MKRIITLAAAIAAASFNVSAQELDIAAAGYIIFWGMALKALLIHRDSIPRRWTEF